MEYALKVLNRHGPVSGQPTRRKRFVDEVILRLLRRRAGPTPSTAAPPAARCAAAPGRVRVTPPVVTCRLCGGSGRVGGDLICLTCRGVGVVPVRFEADTCPRCGGSGEEGIFYCNACKGQGIV